MSPEDDSEQVRQRKVRLARHKTTVMMSGIWAREVARRRKLGANEVLQKEGTSQMQLKGTTLKLQEGKLF